MNTDNRNLRNGYTLLRSRRMVCSVGRKPKSRMARAHNPAQVYTLYILNILVLDWFQVPRFGKNCKVVLLRGSLSLFLLVVNSRSRLSFEASPRIWHWTQSPDSSQPRSRSAVQYWDCSMDIIWYDAAEKNQRNRIAQYFHMQCILHCIYDIGKFLLKLSEWRKSFLFGLVRLPPFALRCCLAFFVLM